MQFFLQNSFTIASGIDKYIMIAYTFLPAEEERVFDCLFDQSFSPNSKIFHSYGDVTTTGYGLQIMTYTKHYSIFKLQQNGTLDSHSKKSRKQNRKRRYRSIVLGCHLLIVRYHVDGKFSVLRCQYPFYFIFFYKKNIPFM